MAPSRKAIIASVALAVLSLHSVTRSLIREILAIPLWTSLLVVGVAVWTISSSIRSDNNASGESKPLLRRYGLRPLTFTTSSAWSAVLTRQSWEETPATASGRLEVSKELDERLDTIFQLVRSSFILPWYSRISPSPAFPNGVETLVRCVLAQLAARGVEIDWSNLLVSKIIPLVKDHIHHYRTVEHLSSSHVAPTSTPSLPLPLPPSKAHPALSQQAHVSASTPLALVEAHFRSTLDRLFQQVLPASDRSKVVHTLVTEVVLGTVLLPTFDMLCDSDFWNRQIDERGGRYLHEQKQVNKFLSALSNLPPQPSSAAPSRTSSPLRPKTAATATFISAASSTRQFEAFLRSITKVKTLGEARRLRADIEREQRTAKAKLDSLVSDKHGTADDVDLRRVRKYVKRLERARLEVDARVAILSKSTGSVITSHRTATPAPAHNDADVDLLAVLLDPSSLAYWLEHMDRRGRSRLVQFWLTVEGFKDPLENLDKGDGMNGTLISPEMGMSASNGSTAIDDLAFLFEMYFTEGSSHLTVSDKHIQEMKRITNIDRDARTASDRKHAKKVMLAAQQAVFDQMTDEDWPGFAKTELYLKAAAELSKCSVAPFRSPLSPSSTHSSVFPAPPKLPTRHTTPLFGQLTSPPAAPSRQASTFLGARLKGSSSTAAVTVSQPHFERSVSDQRPTMTRQISNDGSQMASSLGSLPTIPPPIPRRSSQLDFLFGADAPIVEERTKLFEVDEADIDEEDPDQLQRMEAIQAALNEIIASDDLGASQTFGSSGQTPEPDDFLQSPASSMLLIRHKSDTHDPLGRIASRSVEDLRAAGPKRTISSAPHSRVPSSKPAKVKHRSSMDDLAQNTKSLFADDPIDDKEESEESGDEAGSIPLVSAIPSALDLTQEISRLQSKIEGLVKQEHLLESLIRQAELTGNQSELRILNRSLSSLRREQRTAIFQKAQYEQQEEQDRLAPGKTVVTIPSASMSSGEGGKQVIKYSILVKQDEEGGCGPEWTLSKRYNEFWELDRALRDWLGNNGGATILDSIRELPPKKLVPNTSSSFVDNRRKGLEAYLQSLITSDVLCESLLLRSFLSRSPLAISSSPDGTVSSLAPHNIVKSLVKTMTSSIDDNLLMPQNLLGPNMLDLMYTSLTRQLTDLSGYVGINPDELAGLGSSFLPQALKSGWTKDLPVLDTAPGSSVPSPIQPLGGESGSGSFTAPICDLFIEIFDLKENNWLRRQAIVVILQQFLGGTIERKVRDSIKGATTAESLEKVLGTLQETLWPDGVRRPPSTPRTDAEKQDTRIRAGRKLGMLIPDLAANMIGRGNARRAARRVFGVLQDKRLNQHLWLCILDEVFNAILTAKPAR